jgi:hypothetical protein
MGDNQFIRRRLVIKGFSPEILGQRFRICVPYSDQTDIKSDIDNEYEIAIVYGASV